MKYKIDSVKKEEYLKIIEVWEASVRATHHFLKEEDIAYFKPMILDQYLDLVELSSVRLENNEIVGFLGVSEKNMEMLFLHPDHIGQGLGSMLVNYAIEKYQVNKVDVNEDNERAVAFYKHLGFVVKSRSPLDPQGKPYPILHMELPPASFQQTT